MIFNLFRCEKCQENYQYYSDFNLENLLASQITERWDVAYSLITQKGLQHHKQWLMNCYQQQIPYCELYQNFNTCKKCSKDYFLNKEQKCEKKPQQKIKYCQRYKNINTCEKCSQGYVLEDNACQPIKQIQHCVEYKDAHNLQNCTKCEQGFYSQSYQCLKRSEFPEIENCETLDPFFEKCQRCQSGFIKSIDGLKCVPEIPHCSDYSNFYLDDSDIECLECEKGFILDQQLNSCYEGEIKGCIRYNQQKECQRCEQGFYLLSNQCYLHDVIEDCEEYHHQIGHHCSRCKQGSIFFRQVNECVAKQPDLSCRVFRSQNLCEHCEEGFMLQEGTCVSNQNNAFCRKVNVDGGCVECHSNKIYVPATSSCVEELNYLTQFCGNFTVEQEV